MHTRRLNTSASLYTALAALTLVLAACGGQPTPQPPAAASNVTATPGPGYITVQWQDNSNNETGFEVYRADGSALTALPAGSALTARTADSVLTTQQAGTKVGTVAADVSTFVDLGVDLEQEYSYSVVAVNSVGSSDAAAAPATASVPIGVDLMVGTNNRRWSEDTNGTIFVVYFVFPDALIEDKSDVFEVSIVGPPGWNDGNPRVFQCPWNLCSRPRGFAVSTSNSITALAGDYELTVVAGGEAYTASATLTDPGFKFARVSDMSVTNASAAGGTVAWAAPPGTLSHYLLLYKGEYEEYVDGWTLDATPSFTVDGQELEDGIYGFEIVPINADVSTYPIKVEPFGLSYDYKMFGVGDVRSPLCSSGSQVIAIPDAVLQQVVRAAIGVPTGDITCFDMALLTKIDAPDAGIGSLEGLQYALNLDDVFLHGNDITDLGPVAGLTKMWHLNVNVNEVTDVTALANLTNLTELHVCCSTGNITDVTPLEGLTKLVGLNLTGHQLGDATVWPLLEHYPDLRNLWIGESNLTTVGALADHPDLEILQLSGNVIDDMSVVAGLEHLAELQLQWATIADLTPLYSMTQLKWLDLRGLELTDVSFLEDFTDILFLNLAFNDLTSLAPLVANPGIGSGDFIDVRDNALDLDDVGVQADIQALLARGVNLRYE